MSQVSPASCGAAFALATFFCLAVGEAPYFVALDAAGGDALHQLVMQIGADLPRVDQELGNGVEAHVGQPRGRAHGLAFGRAYSGSGRGS